MALTAYCRKCGREVPPEEICPFCGTKLGKTAIHAAWCVHRTPAADWMSWNSVMRFLLPACGALLIMTLAAEGLAGGLAAVEQLLRGVFLTVVAILLATVLAVVWVCLLLQGKELADFVVDSRGIHETRYLPNPTPLKLLARMKSPALMNQVSPDAPAPVLRLGERHLPWREVARVQLWPEKCMVLFYAPSWWLRIPVVCTPFTWPDVMDYVREKLGRKKKVRLPQSLTLAAPPPRRKEKPAPPLAPEVAEAIDQIRMEDLLAQENSPGEDSPGDQE